MWPLAAFCYVLWAQHNSCEDKQCQLNWVSEFDSETVDKVKIGSWKVY